MKEWMAKELTPTQQNKAHSKKTSIFNAWVYNNLGGKNFVMAMWQTGMTWAPTPELLNSTYNGALEHVAKNFASWIRRLARAVTRHKQHEATQEAQRRSGNVFRQHGLTQEELNNRKNRDEARRNYYWTLKLVKQLELYTGKRVALQSTRSAPEHTIQPKSWNEMTYNEKWWIDEYYSGRLKRAMTDAEAKCHTVEAKRFSIADDD